MTRFKQFKRSIIGPEVCMRILETEPHVLCFVSEHDLMHANLDKSIAIITSYDMELKRFKAKDGSEWEYVLPFDPKTLEPLEITADDTK